MKNILLALMAMLSVCYSYAQNPLIIQPVDEFHRYPDSIRVEFPDQHGLIIFQQLNFKWKPDQLKEAMAVASQVLDQISQSIPSTIGPKKAEVIVSIKGEKSITIRDPETGVTRITSNDKEITQLLPPGWEIHIRLALRYDLYMYAQTFEQLKAIVNFDPEPLKQLLQAEAKKLYMGRKRYIGRFIVQHGETSFSSVKFQMPIDRLEIGGSTAFGHVNQAFYPELNLTASFRFGNRFNVMKNQFSISYNNLFFTSRSADGKFNNRTNSFLNLSYGRNGGTSKSATWFVLGAGYLIMKKGDYFTGKTAKFFFSSNVGKFSVTPELYLTNGFKTFQTGMKIGYTF